MHTRSAKVSVSPLHHAHHCRQKEPPRLTWLFTRASYLPLATRPTPVRHTSALGDGDDIIRGELTPRLLVGAWSEADHRSRRSESVSAGEHDCRRSSGEKGGSLRATSHPWSQHIGRFGGSFAQSMAIAGWRQDQRRERPGTGQEGSRGGRRGQSSDREGLWIAALSREKNPWTRSHVVAGEKIVG